MGLLAQSLFPAWEFFYPVIWLLVASIACVAIELGAKDGSKVRLAVQYTAIGGVVAAFAALAMTWFGLPPTGEGMTVLYDALTIDRFGLFLCGVVLAGTLMACISAGHAAEDLKVSFADFLALVLVAASGMLLLITSNDLIMLFLSIELMSLAIYVLAGCHHGSARSSEAAMKYFVMGGFASGFLLLGLALLYGVTGEVELAPMAANLVNIGDTHGKLPLLGVALALIGFAFKVGAVPFHSWVPDVYTGAPTPVTGFMAVAVKTAAFGAFARLLVVILPEGDAKLTLMTSQVLWLMAAVTMLLGNWIAVSQTSVKRMLAYSGIAHSGYLIMGLLVSGAGEQGLSALMFYLAMYTFATAGAFALLTITGESDTHDDVGALRGLAWRKPGAAAAMTVFMLSLAGVPLTGGFLGKFNLFSAVIDAGHLWLALIGIFASLIGAYYYLKVVVYMYMKEPQPIDGRPLPSTPEFWFVKLALGLCVVGTMWFGLFPASLMDKAKSAQEGLALQRPKLVAKPLSAKAD